MASVPRIITVDPTGSIPQQIRAAFDLMDVFVTQIDVPGASVAIEEMERGGVDAVIAAWKSGDGMQGWELAAKIRQIDENVAIMVLGDEGDTDMDEDMLAQSPFVYLKRPFDIPQLIRVLDAAVRHRDIFEASRASTVTATQVVTANLGPVPSIDVDRADGILSDLIADLNPIGAMVATREGDVVAARQTFDHMDYDEIANIVRDGIISNLHLRDIIGGNAQALQFYDGDEFDVFVLSVGLHHSIILIYDGKEGARQLGPVSRFGRRHAEDLIGIMGANAWIIQAPTLPEPEEDAGLVRKSRTAKHATQEAELPPELARAKISGGSVDEAVAAPTEPEEAESIMPQLEAIDDSAFDPDALFGDLDMDLDGADDLFSLDAMEDLAQEEGKKGTLDWDRAIELGILDD